jgi:hypothetical protein
LEFIVASTISYSHFYVLAYRAKLGDWPNNEQSAGRRRLIKQTNKQANQTRKKKLVKEEQMDGMMECAGHL